MRRTAFVTAAILLALPAGGAARTLEQPVLAFGRVAGNIQPFTVQVQADGTISHSGPVELSRPGVHLSKSQIAALLRLAAAQRFWSLPRRTECGGTVPDVAARFVTVHTAARTRTVTVRGNCSARFARVYRALAAAATVTS